MQKNAGQTAAGFIKESFNILFRYFGGRLKISLIIGIICYIVLWIMGVNLRLLISIIVALFNLVPYLGPMASMVITAVIVIFQDPALALWAIVLNFLLQLLDAWVLSPLILSKSLKVPPVVVIAAIIIGGSLFGILGLLFAVPAAAIIALLIRTIKNSRIK